MGGRNQWEDTGVNDSKILSAIDQQMRVDHTSLFKGQHSSGATGMELGLDAIVDDLTQRSLVCIGRRHKLSWL